MGDYLGKDFLPLFSEMLLPKGGRCVGVDAATGRIVGS